MPKPHILINALSVGGGGGYTVARELFRHLAIARANWRFTLVLTSGDRLHESMAEESLPANCYLLWAPEQTSKQLPRRRYEGGALQQWAVDHEVGALLQLNGMVIPGSQIPCLSHHQDPMPYRPEAWNSLEERVKAFFKRRMIARSLSDAAVCGWTSHYLEDLICSQAGMVPRKSEVFYNGIPESWLERARTNLPSWHDRPMLISTVSNVSAYKRQSLVIEALPHLHALPGLEELKYHIVGDCSPAYKNELQELAKSLSVDRYVVLEGRVSDQRVEEVLAQSRAMVTMSVCESFGIPLLEAMAFGAPVVAANCCALPEVAGDAAELATADELAELVERIAAILTQPDRAEELRIHGAAQVQKFGWSRTAECMAETFEEMLG